DLLCKLQAREWTRVAAIGEEMYEDAVFRLVEFPGRFEDRVEVREQSVDAGIGAEAHQVDGLARGLGLVDRARDDLVFLKSEAAGLSDRDGFLVHDSAGADVLVADLGVTHRALGKADILAAGLDERVGPLAGEAVGGQSEA